MAGGWWCGTSSYSNNSDQHKIATEQMQKKPHSTSSVLLRSSNRAAEQLQKGAVTTGLCLNPEMTESQCDTRTAIASVLYRNTGHQCYQSAIFTSMRCAHSPFVEELN